MSDPITMHRIDNFGNDFSQLHSVVSLFPTIITAKIGKCDNFEDTFTKCDKNEDTPLKLRKIMFNINFNTFSELFSVVSLIHNNKYRQDRKM